MAPISRQADGQDFLRMEDYLEARWMPDNICGRKPMRNDLLRSIYITMLLRCSYADILEYWRHLPLERNGMVLRGGDLFRHFWDENQVTPKEYVARVLGSLEYFLVGRNHDAQEFLSSLVFRINDGTPVPGKTMLRWLAPKIQSIFLAPDLRLKVLELMAETTEQFIPGSYREVLKVEKGPKTLTAWCLWAPDRDLGIRWTYYSELFGLKMMANAPRVLGLPPFTDITSLADTGCLEHILWEEEIAIREGRILIDGEDYGRQLPFREYCRGLGVEIDRLDPPDRIVNLMERDYACPRRKRAVLLAGCAYDAPVWLTKVRFPRMEEDKAAAIQHIIDDTVEGTVAAEKLEGLHAGLLELLAEKAEFLYLSRDPIMMLNGNVLIRGVPAELLAYMLRSHRDAGKTSFLLADFRRDTKIMERRNPNLEAFLEKLRARLEARSQKIRLLSEPGLRILRMDCPVTYREE